jgi:hypothetical protein
VLPAFFASACRVNERVQLDVRDLPLFQAALLGLPGLQRLQLQSAPGVSGASGIEDPLRTPLSVCQLSNTHSVNTFGFALLWRRMCCSRRQLGNG